MDSFGRSIYLDYLRRIPMFSVCSTHELERLADRTRAFVARDGDMIVRQGEPGDEFYVIALGKATVIRDGHEVATLGEGDFFGELALIDPAPRNATVRAEGPVNLVALGRPAFRAVLDDTPSIRDSLLLGLGRRLHQLDGSI